MQPWAGGTLERLPRCSLKQLVAEVPFFDVDWNFLPVEIVENNVAATVMIIHSRYSVLCNALACSCFLHLLTSETLNFEPMTRSWQEHAEIDWPPFWQCMVLLKFRFIEQSFRTLGRYSEGIENNKQKILGTCSEIAFASWHVTLPTWPSAAPSAVSFCLPSSWRSSSHLGEGKVELSSSCRSWDIWYLRYLLNKGGQKSWLYASNMPVLKIESLIKV